MAFKIKKQSQLLDSQIDSAVAVFTNTMNSLRKIEENALKNKAMLKEQIKTLEDECSALDDVCTKTSNIVDKLTGLFAEPK